ncbi:N-acetylmuramoyl-L-alanine amidase [Oscillospiraceae bacterium OttesenSCG-928-F05]|nr:N-acetylmuramoyl-L-alanine amidase [Oscillospiraceae bacterium OttesenSCG-928-F05]
MSNSPLVVHTNLSPNCTKPRNAKIDTITIHCMAGNLSIETCGNVFAPSSRQASSNYGIGSDGRVGLYVDEANRSWCTSSASNDHRAVTIEVANTVAADPWPVSDKALAALINLCTDICERNGIEALLWQGDKSLIGQVALQNMTVHRWFAAKACPGDYLYNLHTYIADEVNKRLGTTAANTAPATTPADGFEVGDIVNFTGTTHYSSASAASGSTCKPGLAKVSTISASSKRPYHLIAEKDGSSTVYGWVNAADVSALTQNIETEEETVSTTYEKLGDVPSSYRPTIQKLMEAGALAGKSDPDPDSLEDNILDIDETYCRVMTTLDRLGKLD